jgi:hypothetical protein
MSIYVDFDAGDWLKVEIETRSRGARLSLRDTRGGGAIEITQSDEGLRAIAAAIVGYFVLINADDDLHALYGEIGPQMAAAFDRVESELAAEHGVPA